MVLVQEPFFKKKKPCDFWAWWNESILGSLVADGDSFISHAAPASYCTFIFRYSSKSKKKNTICGKLWNVSLKTSDYAN